MLTMNIEILPDSPEQILTSPPLDNPPPRPKHTLMSLPLEIRYRIYDQLAFSKRRIFLGPKDLTPAIRYPGMYCHHTILRRASKTLKAELELWYKIFKHHSSFIHSKVFGTIIPEVTIFVLQLHVLKALTASRLRETQVYKPLEDRYHIGIFEYWQWMLGGKRKHDAGCPKNWCVCTNWKDDRSDVAIGSFEKIMWAQDLRYVDWESPGYMPSHYLSVVPWEKRRLPVAIWDVQDEGLEQGEGKDDLRVT